MGSHHELHKALVISYDAAHEFARGAHGSRFRRYDQLPLTPDGYEGGELMLRGPRCAAIEGGRRLKKTPSTTSTRSRPSPGEPEIYNEFLKIIQSLVPVQIDGED